jgi:SAM-dependent methyltransferase
VPAELHTELPYPGAELAYRVTGAVDGSAEACREWFFESGRRSAEELRAALAVASRRPESHKEVLDFGCGPGRVLLWLRDLAANGASLHGTDIDARAIGWAREHIPWASFTVNDPLPPLPYADSAFDLVFNHSVFTHIDASYQDQWLAELHRVTRPGAMLLLSVNGLHAFSEFERLWRTHGGDPTEIRVMLERDGIVFLRDDSWFGSAFPDFYHSTFHLPGYVIDRWGWYFEVRGYLPRHALGHQDVVLLERREGDLPAGAPPDRIVVQPVAPVLPSSERLVAQIETLLARGPGGPPPDHEARLGTAAAAARRAVERAMRPYTAHRRQVDQALLEAAAALFTRAALAAKDVGAMREGVLRQSERISRLELELLEHIEQLDARISALEGGGGLEP